MLYSFGTREGEDRGVLASDLVAAALVPGRNRNTIVAALHDLREEELHLRSTGRRYRFEPTYNRSKPLRDEAAKFQPEEAGDLFPADLQRFAAQEGEEAVLAEKARRPDGEWHYGFNANGKVLLVRFRAQELRSRHVQRWLDPLMLLRGRMGLAS